MAVLQYRTLSNRTVATLSVERDTVFWDRELTGFGVRVYPSGGKVFVAQARGPDGPDKPNRPRRITVGRHPVLSAEQARQRAALIIARVKAGEDPVPLPLPAKYAGGPTVTDLANRYLEEHVAVRCKPKTQRTARSVVNRHIVPALGKLPIAAVERRHVMALHESLCETPAMANVVRRRRLTPRNRSESTCYHADRRPICTLNNTRCAPAWRARPPARRRAADAARGPPPVGRRTARWACRRPRRARGCAAIRCPWPLPCAGAVSGPVRLA